MNTFSNGIKGPKVTWLSLHLFYHGDRFRLLQDCLYPLLTNLLKQRQISIYFFIHYGEGGRHIRLRVLPYIQQDRKEVYEKIHETVNVFFKKTPSKREDGHRENKELFPNDSIQEITYQAELSRYGGPIFITTIEHFFYHSSRFVMQSLTVIMQGGYASALLLSLKMNLLMLHGLAFDKLQLELLYRDIWYDWLGSTYRMIPDQNLSIAGKKELILKLFKTSMEKQYGVFSKVYQLYFSNPSLLDLTEVEEVWLDKARLLKDKFDEKIEKVEAPFDHESAKKRFIVKSLIHMNNNRLNLQNHDESFLAFVIYKLVTENQG